MKKLQFFGERDLDEFKEYANMSSSFPYVNEKGERWDFHLDPYGRDGVQVYDYQLEEITGSYETLDELINTHVFPDGAKFKDVLYGENYHNGYGL